MHHPNPGKVVAYAAVSSMKRVAESTEEATSVVLSSQLQQLDEASQGALPTVSALKQRIRRLRTRKNKAPPCPRSLTELEIPDEYKKYQPGPGITEQFLLHDSGSDENRFLIFGRPRALQVLRNSKIWFGDGTFSITPPLFYQVFVLLGQQFGSVHPLLYILLPGKKRSLYRDMFAAIKELSEEPLQPEIFSCDFEIGLMKEFLNAFPDSRIGGCLFHFSQNVIRRVQHLHLMRAYENEPELNLQVRMVIALAFTPPSDTTHVFELLEVYVDARLEPLLEYLEDNYIGRRSRTGRKNPPFRVEWWNVYDRTTAGEPRTNNYAEAGHGRLQNEFGFAHPTIWRFIETLRKVQKARDLAYLEADRGVPPAPKRRKYADVDARLVSIVSSYDSREPLDYLRAIAHNL